MSRHASVVRDDLGLLTLTELLSTARARNLASRADFEDAALTVTAAAVAAAALDRLESRGCHHRADHPDLDASRAVSDAVRLDGEGLVAVAHSVEVCS
jgi:L-aspartate oxidase